ncbi:MAG: type I polyketide synthase [Actinobacteria bacterium]|nr:type I polyketide synthase [Actinomycetota bacterium]
MTNLAALAAQLSPKGRELLARELVRAGTTLPDESAAEPIAVIGIGCRFPGNVTDPHSYWDLLANGRDAITEVPADRWDADEYYDPDPAAPGRMTTKWGGFVDDVAGFDADFFGITPREATAMDPQHRMALEVAWEALEHAGIAPDSLAGSRTAVMMGLSSFDYTIVNVERRAEIDAYVSTGSPHCAAVGRISYLLGLRGPSVAVDTACSSSLVSVHLACQSLRTGESDLALAGGVTLHLSAFSSIAMSKLSALSPVGRCKSFDAAADGFVRGEGCGVVVLKRLSDAVRDKDRVLAVIRGSAVNQDGKSNGLTAPSALAQRDVITEALRVGDVPADSINYVEAHGTGTVLGDPIEFESLAATYGRGDTPCGLGSVKTNMGHLEAAAGIAGFIKATLAVGHGQIPPNLHFNRWNQAIDAASTRFFVPTADTAWPASAGPRRAAISSFGVSGTNAHIVVEQGPEPAPVARGAAPAVTTLVVSGKTPQRVASMAAALADWVEGPGAQTDLADVAHTLTSHRARHGRLATVSARDRAEAVAGLRALAAGLPAPGVVSHNGTGGRGRVFVYSGQGSQWAGMGRRLLADEPAFAAAIDRLEPVFVAEAGFSLREVVAGGQPVSGIARIQPVLVGVQLALTELWRAYGVTPDAVIGHSMGEVTAAVVSGALTVAEGLRVISTRSRLMSRLSGQGAMALLELGPDETAAALAGHPDVSLAVYASPRQSVIAGPPDEVDRVIAAVQQQNRLARRVDVDVASHHPTIDPILPELRTALAGLAPTPPSIPLIGTVHDGAGPAATALFDADYWVANLRNPVRFSQAVAEAARNHGTFVEMSPHPLLTHAIADTLEVTRPEAKTLVTSAMNRDDDSTLFFHAQLAAVGASAPAAAGARLADVPATPWHHTTYWVPDRSMAGATNTTPALLGTHTELPGGAGHVWRADVGTAIDPWLGDHKVFGQAIMPAAGFVEIALAAGTEALRRPVESLLLTQLEIEHMLPLDGHTRITTQLIPNPDKTFRVEVHSRPAHGDWTRHAVAQLATAPPPDRSAVTWSDSSGTEVAPADLYAALRHIGQHHGPAFMALTRAQRLPDGSAVAEINLPEEAPRYPGCHIHPVLLDAALQTLAAAMPHNPDTDSRNATYLPVSFERVQLFKDAGRSARCRAEVVDTPEAGGDKLGNVTLIDDAGTPVAVVTGVRLRQLARTTVPLSVEQKVFEAAWVDQPIAAAGAPATSAATPGTWLVLRNTADAALADGFVHEWRSPTRRVVTADLGDEAAVLAAVGEAGEEVDLPPVGVVVFVDHLPLDSADPDTALTRARDAIWAAAGAVRAVVGGWHGRSPRLWLVSRRGLAVDGQPGDPAVGALRGLIRTLVYEHPELQATLVDLDTAGDALAVLRAELEAPGTDDVVAWRAGHRKVERISRAAVAKSGAEPPIRPDGAYVVTGGLGGIGLEVARWLVDKGAGRVVLNGRSEPSPEHQARIEELRDRAEIAVVRGDIAVPGVADELVAAAESGRFALRGVVHCAAVLDDHPLVTMSADSLDRVWAPKAAGALRLHLATRDAQLDWWIGFSSMASLLGSPGQTAYACANAWVDAMASWRRASGLPGSAINWGLWSGVGMAQTVSSSAVDAMTPDEGIEAFECVVVSGRTQTGVARLRPDRALAAFPEIRRLGYFSAVVEETDLAGDDGDWPGPEGLRDLPAEEVTHIVVDRLRLRIAAVMGHSDLSAVDPAVPLIELGMDSLMAVRIRNSARADFGVEPPVALLLQGASLHDIATDLLQQLGLAGHTSAEPAEHLRDRAQRRAAARQEAAQRRKRGQRV